MMNVSSNVCLPATISAYLGVTEPALFGVNVKYIYPFVAGMIGSSIAGLLSVIKPHCIGRVLFINLPKY